MRTRDGRPLKARFGGPGLLEANLNVLPDWSTLFLLVSPFQIPAQSGDKVMLAAADGAFAASPNLMRVEHGARRNGELWGYVMGGPDTRVWATTPFSAGFPGYSANDPDEWEFFVVKDGVGPIQSGDEVSIRIGQSVVTEGPYYFRVSGVGDGVPIAGDGTMPFQQDTAFVIDFVEVRPGVGARPTTVVCQVCAAVTGTVLGRGAQPVAGATITSRGDAVVSHPFSASTDGAGRFRLVDADGRDCIPPGPLTVIASADRYETNGVDATVPTQDAVDVLIQLVCTVVQGRVIETVGGVSSPMVGVEVSLTYEDGESVIVDTDPILGTFQFVCVRHVPATVVTDLTSPQQVVMGGGPIPDTGVRDIVIEVVRGTACPDITGTVTDAVTGAPIAGASIIVQNTTPPGVYTATTDARGHYTIPTVCLTGVWSIKASSLPGYISNTRPTGPMPPSGSVTVDIVLTPRVLPQAPHTIDITLFWGEEPAPRDLDSHLSGPDPAGGARFHCFFPQLRPVDFVALDVDDTTWSGPEHIVVVPRQVAGQSTGVQGDYHYWVHNFSDEAPFAQSSASVTLLIDGARVASFAVSVALGDPTKRIWRIFDLTVAADNSIVVSTLQFNGQPAPAGYFTDGISSDIF